MRVWCQLCELSFEEPLELEVHYLSLSHHIKLEANSPVVHSCSPCGITGLSLGEYSKHVDTENHRKKRERIRAIIDTMDAGEGLRVHFNFNRIGSQHVTATPSYLEPTSSFVRSGFQRSTYPVPKTGDGARPHHTRSRRPKQQSCDEAFEGSSSYQQKFDPFQTTNPSRNDEEWARNLLHSMPSAHSPRGRFPTQFETDGRSNDAVQLNSRCVDEDRYDAETSEDNVLPQKRGLLARLSLRRRGKAAKMSSSEKSAKEKDKKTKRKKSQSSSPASPSSKTKVGESESPSRRRAALLNVALEDKTKKWELVAVKGKASYLKNRSQRMFKDRMNKYRLVDSKGMVVEDIHEEEATSSNNSQATSGGKREATLPQFTSHIWGTGPEATVPLSQRSDFHSEAHRVSKLPPIPPPRAPLISSSSSSQEESSSGYATLNVLPMSTPKNYNAAMRAYENYEECKLKVLDRVSDSKAPVFGVASTNTDTVSTVSGLDSFCSHSFTSSLAVESHSLTSRLNLTNANADQTDVVTVKEETVDSPPLDALPSPPQFEQTTQPNFTTEGRMAGDKERDEFWALGIAEHKKGHEILDMRAKVEKLQKELIEATSCLQKLEVEMNEILRRNDEVCMVPYSIYRLPLPIKSFLGLLWT
ncbi:unnamed protein product [Cylicocyclus nassatus]|uniref:C2H2-type domain-containing protein n=1 Tax=Cylicocyclus nassatus TaxID=53992 RepID=A0AA36M9G9_CYLNA|nr:unnamed protein product [Cylicocyclus nassatus]